MASNNSSKLMLLFLAASPVQIMVGWEYYRGFWRALRKWSFNMDSLVVLGAQSKRRTCKEFHLFSPAPSATTGT